MLATFCVVAALLAAAAAVVGRRTRVPDDGISPSLHEFARFRAALAPARIRPGPRRSRR